MAKSRKNGLMKFAWRNNLIYPLHLLIWTAVRKVLTMLLNYFFEFGGNLLFTLLMFFAEFITGLFLYIYEQSSLKKNKITHQNTSNYLLYNEMEMKPNRSPVKILFLIFVASYSDFIEFILMTNYAPRFSKCSPTLEIRLGGILTITSALFFYFLLKLPILRHQHFSLSIIVICLIITVITEYIFQDINFFMTYGEFSLTLVFLIFEQFFLALLDSSEKYVVEYEFMNCYKTLSIEGFFGMILTIIGIFLDDNNAYQSQLKQIYSEKSGGIFALFIFLLFVYTVLCGLKNAYRVLTNKIYSPMAKSLTDYFLNPAYIIYNFSTDDDFKTNGKKNYVYFFLNLILSILVSFCGCVFNEIIILFFCDFERETHDQVSWRANLNYLIELKINSSNDDDEDGTNISIITEK